jgi:hypothetical protein
LVPAEGALPLTFGITPDEAKRILGKEANSTRTGNPISSRIEYFRDVGVNLHYDESQLLHEIVFYPTNDLIVRYGRFLVISGKRYFHKNFYQECSKVDSSIDNLGNIEFLKLGLYLPRNLNDWKVISIRAIIEQ